MVPGDNNGAIVNGTVLVYDIKDDRWVTQYKPFSAPSPTQGPPTSTGSIPSPDNSGQPSSSGGINTAAIGGGVAGAVVLGLAVSFFIYRRRKQSNQKKEPDGDPSSLSTKPSLPPYQPPLLPSRPTNVISQHEFTNMVPIEPVATISIVQRPTYHNDPTIMTNPQGPDPLKRNNNRASVQSTSRNPQHFPTISEKTTRDPQYHPSSPLGANRDIFTHKQQLNHPQGDGTDGSSAGVDAQKLRQQLELVRVQHQEQQELVRKLQDQLQTAERGR
ncbi:hypothetical protein BGX33_012425 [Mortierella sp. NVP41]|nr:hypothetical protein BGX33_012425 [Mortierella sp. NVP41]